MRKCIINNQIWEVGEDFLFWKVKNGILTLTGKKITEVGEVPYPDSELQDLIFFDTEILTETKVVSLYGIKTSIPTSYHWAVVNSDGFIELRTEKPTYKKGWSGQGKLLMDMIVEIPSKLSLIELEEV